MNFIIVSSCFILIVNADLGPIKQYPACSNNGVAGEQKLFQCKEKCPSDWTFIKDEAKNPSCPQQLCRCDCITEWFGTRPFCDGQCPPGFTEIKRADKSDSQFVQWLPCITGTKALCGKCEKGNSQVNFIGGNPRRPPIPFSNFTGPLAQNFTDIFNQINRSADNYVNNIANNIRHFQNISENIRNGHNISETFHNEFGNVHNEHNLTDHNITDSHNLPNNHHINDIHNDTAGIDHFNGSHSDHNGIGNWTISHNTTGEAIHNDTGKHGDHNSEILTSSGLIRHPKDP